MTRPDLSHFVSYSYAELYEMKMERERQKKEPSFHEIIKRINSGMKIKGMLSRNILDELRELKELR
jgi:predicted nucleic acid-binding OB-fold protein